MANSQKTTTSKFISLILRHDPAAAGITLDPQGWAKIDLMLEGMAARGSAITYDDLMDIVDTDEKQRYVISADGESIRANQGHSIKVDLELSPTAPPDVLYHGTPKKFVEQIRASGLKKMARQYVHLSPDLATATRVGQRRGQPHLLKIDAAAMHRDGFLFYCSANGVWLCDAVPAQYLSDA